MASATRASTTPPDAAAGDAGPAPGRPGWQLALVAGLCFGLGYGVVQRLMDLELPQLVQLAQPFEVRAFPGTTLESLRLQAGAEQRSIRADLALFELEEQQRQAEQRRAEELAQRAEQDRQETLAQEATSPEAEPPAASPEPLALPPPPEPRLLLPAVDAPAAPRP